MTDTVPDPDTAPTRPPWGQKVVATAVHLALSATAVGALLLVATTLWYPDHLFSSDGGWQGLRIVVLVDLVLGPALTFVVFRRGKPGLVTDLALIAALQVAAFAGGAWILWDERPLALVLVDGSFYSVSRDDFQIADVPVPDRASPCTRTRRCTGP
jgi:drug/metabolite transporter (DMT)-like permease